MVLVGGIMSLLSSLKKNGIGGSIRVFYQYKIDALVRKVLKVLFIKAPLQNIIILESHNDFDCNAGAFYDYLIKNEYNKKYKIIWLLKNEIPNELPQNVCAFHMFKPSVKKDYYNCIAKYLMADCNVIEKMRSDQICVYLGHGIPLKSVKGVLNIPEYVDYVLSPSEHFDSIIGDQYSCKNDKLIHVGFPCDDNLFLEGKGKREIDKLTTKKYESVVLWMPTFRKGGGYGRNDSTSELPLGIPLIENRESYEKLNKMLGERNIFLIIKIHPMQDISALKISDMSNIKVLTGKTVKELNIDNYLLMKDVDALISDYSSIAFDYLLLNRPLAYVLSDVESYRGFAMVNPKDYMPGEHIYTLEDFTKFILDLAQKNDTYSEHRMRLISHLFEYTDGNSCERLANYLRISK